MQEIYLSMDYIELANLANITRGSATLSAARHRKLARDALSVMGLGRYLYVGPDSVNIVANLRRYGAIAEAGDRLDLPYRDWAYDVVIASSPLNEPWEDWYGKALSAATRIARRGALVILERHPPEQRRVGFQEQCERLALDRGFKLHPALDTIVPFETLDLYQDTAVVLLTNDFAAAESPFDLGWAAGRKWLRAFILISQYAERASHVRLVSNNMNAFAAETFRARGVRAHTEQYSIDAFIGSACDSADCRRLSKPSLTVLSLVDSRPDTITGALDAVLESVAPGHRFAIIFDGASPDARKCIAEWIARHVESLLLDQLSAVGERLVHLAEVPGSDDEVSRDSVIAYVATTNPCLEKSPVTNKGFRNAGLIRAMVDRGQRVTDRGALKNLALQVQWQSDPGTPDHAAATCVIGYQILEDMYAGNFEEEPGSVLSQIDRNFDLLGDQPSEMRWRISLSFLGGELCRQISDEERATEFFLKCTQFDPLRVTPLIATKVVGAHLRLARQAMCVENYPLARSHLQAGIICANKCVGTDWPQLLDGLDKPNTYALAELTQVCDLAATCARGLAAISSDPIDAGNVWRSVNSTISEERELLAFAHQEIAAWANGLGDWAVKLRGATS